MMRDGRRRGRRPARRWTPLLRLLVTAAPLLLPRPAWALDAILTADAYTDSTKPATHFGPQGALQGSPTTRTFLHFDLAPLPRGRRTRGGGPAVGRRRPSPRRPPPPSARSRSRASPSPAAMSS